MIYNSIVQHIILILHKRKHMFIDDKFFNNLKDIVDLETFLDHVRITKIEFYIYTYSYIITLTYIL